MLNKEKDRMKEIYKLPWQFWALTIFLICIGTLTMIGIYKAIY